MSIIFGIIKNNKLAGSDELSFLSAPLKKLPHDGFFDYTKDNICMGLLHLAGSPESASENQPYISNSGDIVMISKGRLDNRDDLCKIFDINNEQKDKATDSFLIYLAYMKWGAGCPPKLFGDWAFAVYDFNGKKLFIARDHFGVTSFYYAIVNGNLIFSTSIHPVMAYKGFTPEINLVTTAQMLTGWIGFDDSTFFRQIKRLPPATAGFFSGGRLELKKYWTLEDIPEIKFKKEEDYLLKARELFLHSVKARLRNPGKIAVTLSSGLDSGSVTATAAELLEYENRDLFAFTAVPWLNHTQYLKEGTYGDESALSSLTAGRYSNIIFNKVYSQSMSPLGGIKESLSVHGMPVRNASNQYWILSVLESAAKINAGTLLTGQGGNLTISWPLRGYTGNSDKSRFFLSLRKFLSQFRNNYRRLYINTFINETFANEINLTGIMKKWGYNPYRIYKNSLNSIRNDTFRIFVSQGSSYWQEKGDAFGLNICDPTLDFKLVEFCFGIPDEQFVNKNNSRVLVKNMMKDKLPAEILYNTKRGKQAADLIPRLCLEKEQLLSVVDKAVQNELCNKTINLLKMKNTILALNNDVRNSQMFEASLLRAVSIGLFLLKSR